MLSHGLTGFATIIARSFTELLYRLYENRGYYIYWFKPEFNDKYSDVFD